MSTALAIAGVTQVLRDLLNDRFVNQNVAGQIGQSVTVSTMPPDKVVQQNGIEVTQLNLFMRQVTPNLGWRNEGLPSRDASGRTRLSNPPLAINLHYLISAYGAADLHAEILLGHAMQLLHENPVIPREAIRSRAAAAARPGGHAAALAACAARLRTAGPDRAAAHHAGVSQHRGHVQVLDLDAGALPAECRVRSVGGAHPGGGSEAQPAARAGAAVPGATEPRAHGADDLRGRAVRQATRGRARYHRHARGLHARRRHARSRADATTASRSNEILPATGGNATKLEFSIPIARAADFPAGVYHGGGAHQTTDRGRAATFESARAHRRAACRQSADDRQRAAAAPRPSR